MNSIAGRMHRMYCVLRREHGTRVVPLLALPVMLLLRGAVNLCMLLDLVFFPRLRQARAVRPIVIVGNPRTGTTFFQRFLAREGFGAGMQLVFMFCPSLLLQRLLKPLLPWLDKAGPARLYPKESHDTSLSSVDTDDAAIMFRYVDGLFLYGFFMSFDDEDVLPLLHPRHCATAQRDFTWLETLWRRNLAWNGAQRNVVKLFSLALRMPQFQQHFPEARVLYMARDPRSVIPSAMSLFVDVIDRAVGFWSKPQHVRQRWLDRMYEAWLLLLGQFHRDWESGAIDRDRVLVVRYDRMMAEFETVMHEVCEFVGHDMTAAQRAKVQEQADKQRAYESRHRYDLQKFGLSEERILKDFAFYFDTFLPALPSASRR